MVAQSVSNFKLSLLKNSACSGCKADKKLCDVKYLCIFQLQDIMIHDDHSRVQCSRNFKKGHDGLLKAEFLSIYGMMGVAKLHARSS